MLAPPPLRRTARLAACTAAFALAVLLQLPPAASAAHGSARASVVGGTPATIQQVPWQVFLSLDAPTGACGGAILDPLRVLTAAHCVVPDGHPARSPSAITVVAGVSDLSGTRPPTAQVVGVAAVRVHPGYVANDYQGDDVAVLTLARPLDLSTSSARAIPLAPLGAAPPPGTPLAISGYGAQGDGTAPDGRLYTGRVTAIGDDACRSLLTANASATTLCASPSPQATCSGDSGGALTTATGVRQLVGVTSFVPRSGCLSGPGGYADVTVPEVRAFIDGAAAIPRAPRISAAATLRGVVPPVLGSPLTCEPGSWSEGPAFTFVFQAEPAGQVLQSGPSNVFTPTAPHLGMAVACVVHAANGGGTSTTRTGTTTPLAADTVAPRSAIRKVSCRRRACTLRIAAADANSLGPLRLLVRSRERVRGRCRRGRGRNRRVVPCLRTRTRTLAVRSLGGTAYVARTRRALARGRVQLVVQAIDAAGNRQRRAAKATVRIGASRQRAR